MRILIFGGLLLLCGLLSLGGCSSSDRISNSQDVRLVEPSEGVVSKLTITTDYSATMPETNIEFTVPEGGYVFIEATNATGYSIKVLVDGEIEAGTHTVFWDLTNEDGDVVEPGIYMMHLGGPDGGTWAPWVYIEL